MDGDFLDAVVGHVRHVYASVGRRIQGHVVHADLVTGDDAALVHTGDEFVRQRPPKVENAVCFGDSGFEPRLASVREVADGRHVAEDLFLDGQ